MGTRIFSVVLGILLMAIPALAQDVIGRVQTAAGTAVVTRGGDRLPVEVGMPVHQGDVFETEVESSVGITFADESRIAIGPKSELTIDEYVYAPKDEQLSFATRMARGTFLYASGVIARLAPEKVSVTTPDGTIGIRGTRFVVKVAETRI